MPPCASVAAMTEIFTRSFTQQEPLPQDAIQAALTVMQSGRLHRYNLVGDEEGEVSYSLNISILEEDLPAAVSI